MARERPRQGAQTVTTLGTGVLVNIAQVSDTFLLLAQSYTALHFQSSLSWLMNWQKCRKASTEPVPATAADMQHSYVPSKETLQFVAQDVVPKQNPADKTSEVYGI